MKEYKQTIFLIEGFQPSWLGQFERHILTLSTSLAVGVALFPQFVASIQAFDPNAVRSRGDTVFISVITAVAVAVISGPSFWERNIHLTNRLKWSRQKLAADLVWTLNAIFLSIAFYFMLAALVLLAAGVNLKEMRVIGIAIFSLFAGVLIGTVTSLIQGSFFGLYWTREVPSAPQPNSVIYTSFMSGFYGAVYFGIVGFLLGGLTGGWFLKSAFELNIGAAIGCLCLILGWFVSGGWAWFRHWMLRLSLYLFGAIPLNYSKFLNYCSSRILLYKVGSGYIFIHRMLLGYFADLTDDDIKLIAASAEASRSKR